MWECFYEHHKPVDSETIKLHLPCGHLCNRPARRVVTVQCDSGEHLWSMVWDDSNKAWNAVKANG